MKVSYIFNDILNFYRLLEKWQEQKCSRGMIL